MQGSFKGDWGTLEAPGAGIKQEKGGGNFKRSSVWVVGKGKFRIALRVWEYDLLKKGIVASRRETPHTRFQGERDISKWVCAEYTSYMHKKGRGGATERRLLGRDLHELLARRTRSPSHEGGPTRRQREEGACSQGRVRDIRISEEPP